MTGNRCDIIHYDPFGKDDHIWSLEGVLHVIIGTFKAHISYMMHPRAHMSLLRPYGWLLQTSGER